MSEHEWQCPACGAVTRARLSDHPTDTDRAVLVDIINHTRLLSDEAMADVILAGTRIVDLDRVDELQAALDDLWACIAKQEIDHLHPMTRKIAVANHNLLWHTIEGEHP